MAHTLICRLLRRVRFLICPPLNAVPDLSHPSCSRPRRLIGITSAGLACLFFGLSNLAHAQTFTDPLAEPSDQPNAYALFNGLDKTTAETTTFKVKIGETVQFGALLIKPLSCYSRPATETQQTSALVDIEQITLKRTVLPLYKGWLIAEHPSLSELAHPIYDISLKTCSND